jgi:hypothetical protein
VRARGRHHIRTVAAVYGQILTIAVVAALSEDPKASAGEILLSVVLTMLVFWLAHGYAEAVAERLDRPDPLTWREVRAILWQESPVMRAAVPALIALGLGWAGAFSTPIAANLAIAFGVAALFGWGLLISRRSRLSPLATAGAVVVNGGFGLAIVALKVIVH